MESDIDDILEQSARVPLQQVHACRESLVHRVRDRLLGRCTSRLDRGELETLITQHGGFHRRLVTSLYRRPTLGNCSGA